MPVFYPEMFSKNPQPLDDDKTIYVTYAAPNYNATCTRDNGRYQLQDFHSLNDEDKQVIQQALNVLSTIGLKFKVVSSHAFCQLDAQKNTLPFGKSMKAMEEVGAFIYPPGSFQRQGKLGNHGTAANGVRVLSFWQEIGRPSYAIVHEILHALAGYLHSFESMAACMLLKPSPLKTAKGKACHDFDFWELTDINSIMTHRKYSLYGEIHNGTIENRFGPFNFRGPCYAKPYRAPDGSMQARSSLQLLTPDDISGVVWLLASYLKCVRDAKEDPKRRHNRFLIETELPRYHLHANSTFNAEFVNQDALNCRRRHVVAAPLYECPEPPLKANATDPAALNRYTCFIEIDGGNVTLYAKNLPPNVGMTSKGEFYLNHQAALANETCYQSTITADNGYSRSHLPINWGKCPSSAMDRSETREPRIPMVCAVPGDPVSVGRYRKPGEAVTTSMSSTTERTLAGQQLPLSKAPPRVKPFLQVVEKRLSLLGFQVGVSSIYAAIDHFVEYIARYINVDAVIAKCLPSCLADLPIARESKIIIQRTLMGGMTQILLTLTSYVLAATPLQPEMLVIAMVSVVARIFFTLLAHYLRQKNLGVPAWLSDYLLTTVASAASYQVVAVGYASWLGLFQQYLAGIANYSPLEWLWFMISLMASSFCVKAVSSKLQRWLPLPPLQTTDIGQHANTIEMTARGFQNRVPHSGRSGQEVENMLA